MNRVQCVEELNQGIEWYIDREYWNESMSQIKNDQRSENGLSGGGGTCWEQDCENATRARERQRASEKKWNEGTFEFLMLSYSKLDRWIHYNFL